MATPSTSDTYRHQGAIKTGGGYSGSTAAPGASIDSSGNLGIDGDATIGGEAFRTPNLHDVALPGTSHGLGSIDWSPTDSAATNFTGGLSIETFSATQLGGVIAFAGNVLVNDITNANTVTSFELTPPVAVSMSLFSDIQGAGSAKENTGTDFQPAQVIANTATNNIKIQFYPASTANDYTVGFSGMYQP